MMEHFFLLWRRAALETGLEEVAGDAAAAVYPSPAELGPSRFLVKAESGSNVTFFVVFGWPS